MNPKLLIVTDLGVLKACELTTTPRSPLHLDRLETVVLDEAQIVDEDSETAAGYDPEQPLDIIETELDRQSPKPRSCFPTHAPSRRMKSWHARTRSRRCARPPTAGPNRSARRSGFISSKASSRTKWRWSSVRRSTGCGT